MASYQYEMSATIDAMSGFDAWSEAAMCEHPDLPASAVNVLLVCLQELICNIVSYATRDDRPSTVKVEVQIGAEEISVLLEDDGPPFDPLAAEPRPAETDLASASLGGRGLLIVRSMTRSVSYQRSGEWNRLRLEIT